MTLEERASELEGKLTVKEEILNRLARCLKEAGEKADKSNQHISQLESLLKVNKEKMKEIDESCRRLAVAICWPKIKGRITNKIS